MKSNNKESKLFFNWLLSWNPNLVYDRFVNNDVVRPSYSKIKGKTAFSLRKRKAYRNIMTLIEYDWRESTDCVMTRRWKCWTEWRDLYFYMLSPDWQQASILKAYQESNWHINCVAELTKPFCACECWSWQFQKTAWARWVKKISWYKWKIIWVNLWTTEEPNRVQRFVDEDWQEFSPWDYLYIKCWDSTANASAFWQVREIIKVNTDWTISLSSPFLWIIAPYTLENIEFEVYEDYWEVILYPTCNGMMMINPYNQYTSSVCWTQSSTTCIKSIIQNNWNIMYLNDRWFLSYSQWWMNNLYFNASSTLSLWPQVINAVNFKRNVIYFWNDFTWVVYQNILQDWTITYNQYQLSETKWVRSNNSYMVDDDAFIMLSNDKRLYSVSLVANGQYFELRMEDISDLFRWDLDLIQPWDEVYISKYHNEIRIHIVWGIIQDIDNRTKMLIFDKDYKFYHIHTVCCDKITKSCWDLFLWSWIFARCWYEDCWFTNAEWEYEWWSYYDQIISLTLWTLENNWTWIDPLRPKKISYLKTLIWPSIITDSTSISYTVDRDCYKWQYQIRDFKNCFIDNWNKAYQWLEIEPDECIIDDLQECQNIKQPCLWIELQEEETVCRCPLEKKDKQDYCICYKDNSYFLSDTYSIVSKYETKRSTIISIEWRAWWWDDIYYQWMVWRVHLLDYDNDYNENVIENEKCCYDTCEKKCVF